MKIVHERVSFEFFGYNWISHDPGDPDFASTNKHGAQKFDSISITFIPMKRVKQSAFNLILNNSNLLQKIWVIKPIHVVIYSLVPGRIQFNIRSG